MGPETTDLDTYLAATRLRDFRIHNLFGRASERVRTGARTETGARSETGAWAR